MVTGTVLSVDAGRADDVAQALFALLHAVKPNQLRGVPSDGAGRHHGHVRCAGTLNCRAELS